MHGGQAHIARRAGSPGIMKKRHMRTNRTFMVVLAELRMGSV